jgi:hypothetical protein
VLSLFRRRMGEAVVVIVPWVAVRGLRTQEGSSSRSVPIPKLMPMPRKVPARGVSRLNMNSKGVR